jgi:hypothetical protein
MQKKDLIFIIPICMDLKFVPETVLDIAVYIKRPYHIIFVDDTKDNLFKDFRGEHYETIHSGGRNGWKRIWVSVNKALLYVLERYDFDFVIYMDEDATVVNPGFDDFIYEHHAETNFDLIAPEDGIQDDHKMTFFPELDTIFPKYNLRHMKITDFRHSIFLAVNVQSKRFVLRMKELGVLEDESLKRTKLISDPFISFICEMIGCKLEPHGGMGLYVPFEPPFLCVFNERPRLKPMIDQFSVLHRTKDMVWDDKELNETELRAVLRDRREDYLRRRV